MAQKTDSQLQTLANTVQNETTASANSATRMGGLLNDFNDSKINNDKISTNITTDTGSNTKIPSVAAVETKLAEKQNSLGFTPENAANKSTNMTTDTGSNTKYPTVAAVESQLSGKQNSLGYTPENSSNKSTDNTLGGVSSSNTLYPSQKAVKDYVDSKSSSYKVCTLNINFNGSEYTIENTFEDTIGVTISTISTQRFSLTATGKFTLGKVCVIPMILTSQNPGLVASIDWTFAPTVNDITLRVTNLSTGALTTPVSKGSGVQWILEVRVYS
jgi:hypothetical protein